MAGAQLSDIQVESLTVDHLTKFIVSFDDMFIIKSWMVALMQNIRNPHDTANTLLPGSMKKVLVPNDRPGCTKRAYSCS